MTQQPQAKYRHDYRAPEYLISDIDLTFDLDAAKTVVTAESKVSRHAAASDVPLRLDGEDLTLIALQVNGQPWSDYKEENNQLVIGGLPEHFTLTIVNQPGGEHRAGRPVSVRRSAVHPVRSGRFPPYHLVSGPSGCAGALYHQNYRR